MSRLDEQERLTVHVAASKGFVGPLKMIKRFFDFSAREKRRVHTPLIAAVEHFRALEWLRSRSDAGGLDYTGCGALMTALEKKAPESRMLLLACACDIERRDMRAKDSGPLCWG